MKRQYSGLSDYCIDKDDYNSKFDDNSTEKRLKKTFQLYNAPIPSRYKRALCPPQSSVN